MGEGYVKQWEWRQPSDPRVLVGCVLASVLIPERSVASMCVLVSPSCQVSLGAAMPNAVDTPILCSAPLHLCYSCMRIPCACMVMECCKPQNRYAAQAQWSEANPGDSTARRPVRMLVKHW